jgi:hypothetical protein
MTHSGDGGGGGGGGGGGAGDTSHTHCYAPSHRAQLGSDKKKENTRMSTEYSVLACKSDPIPSSSSRPLLVHACMHAAVSVSAIHIMKNTTYPSIHPSSS